MIRTGVLQHDGDCIRSPLSQYRVTVTGQGIEATGYLTPTNPEALAGSSDSRCHYSFAELLLDDGVIDVAHDLQVLSSPYANNNWRPLGSYEVIYQDTLF